MKKKALVSLFLLISSWMALPGNAAAGKERWVAIAGKNGEERILYDRDSVIPSGPGMFRVWIAGFDADHFPRKSLEEFDCSNKIVRDAEVISERPNKPAVHTITPSAWRGIVRESPRGDLYKVLCR